MSFNFYKQSIDNESLFQKFGTRNIFTTQGLINTNLSNEIVYSLKYNVNIRDSVKVKDIIVLNDDSFQVTYGTKIHLDRLDALAKSYALYQINRIHKKIITHDIAFEMLSSELIKDPIVYSNLYEVFKAKKDAFEIYETICQLIGCINPIFSSLDKHNLHNIDESQITVKELNLPINHIISSFSDLANKDSLVYKHNFLVTKLFTQTDLQYFVKSIMETFYHQGDSTRILTLLKSGNGILSKTNNILFFLENLKNVLDVCDSMIDVDINADEGFVRFSQGSDAVVFVNTNPTLDFSRTLEYSQDHTFTFFGDWIDCKKTNDIDSIVLEIRNMLACQGFTFDPLLGPWGIPKTIRTLLNQTN